MVIQQVKKHRRKIKGSWKGIGKYTRKKRSPPGKRRIVGKRLIKFKPRVVRFHPRRPVRDVYGQIRSYKKERMR